MKTVKGDMILEKDRVFGESISVEGNISGKDGNRFNLTVRGNIKALDIDARDIKALDIDAWDIKALDIDAWDIDARDIDARDIKARSIDALDIKARSIDAWDIICENRVKKTKDSRTFARIFMKHRSKVERKEW